MIDVDIPQLSFDGIQFVTCMLGGHFEHTYSLESSSTLSPISSSFDAAGMEEYISFGEKTPLSTSHVVRNRTELDSIPSDVRDLWIGLFDTSGIIDYSFNCFQSLQSLVIGNGLFWGLTSFALVNLPSLQSIDIGQRSFFWTASFSLTGCVD